MERTWEEFGVSGGRAKAGRYMIYIEGGKLDRTLCFSRNSLFKGALIITRRTLDGALKCALRDFLREEWRAIRYLFS